MTHCIDKSKISIEEMIMCGTQSYDYQSESVFLTFFSKVSEYFNSFTPFIHSKEPIGTKRLQILQSQRQDTVILTEQKVVKSEE